MHAYEKNDARSGLVLAFAGWLLGFVTMLVVKEGDVGQALSSLLVIMTTAMVAATAIAVSVQRRKTNRRNI